MRGREGGGRGKGGGRERGGRGKGGGREGEGREKGGGSLGRWRGEGRRGRRERGEERHKGRTEKVRVHQCAHMQTHKYISTHTHPCTKNTYRYVRSSRVSPRSDRLMLVWSMINNLKLMCLCAMIKSTIV